MIIVGTLVNRIDSRLLLAFGFSILAYSTFLLSHINLGISMGSVAVPNLINGFASGFIFVPLTTLTMARVRKEKIGNAAGIYNLMRNIGGSIGIASVTTFLVRGSQVHQNYLVANVTAGNPAVMALLHGAKIKFHLTGIDAYSAHRKALPMLYGMVQQQASLLAYADNFRLLAFLALLCIPLAMLFQGARKNARGNAVVNGE